MQITEGKSEWLFLVSKRPSDGMVREELGGPNTGTVGVVGRPPGMFTI